MLNVNLMRGRPSGSSMEPALVSAWRALDVRPAADYRPPPAQAVYSTYTLPTLKSHVTLEYLQLGTESVYWKIL